MFGEMFCLCYTNYWIHAYIERTLVFVSDLVKMVKHQLFVLNLDLSNWIVEKNYFNDGA